MKSYLLYIMRFLIVLFLFQPSLIHAKNFKILDVSNGLSDNTVKTIAQDEQGFIWLGTFNGLCRYDGMNFTVFKHEPNDVFSIVNNHVETILAVDNLLWVGTNGGLNCFSYAENRFYPCEILSDKGERRSFNFPIMSIAECDDRIFVLTTTYELLVQQDGRLFEFCNYDADVEWFAISSYKNGLLLAYNTKGLCLIDPKEKLIIHQLHLRENKDNRVLYYSKNQDVIYAGAGIGCTSETFIIDQYLHIEKVDRTVPNDVKTIVDYQDETLFGTDGGGLASLKGDKLLYFTPKNSNVSSDAIHSLFVDREGSLWIGTYRAGLNFYSMHYEWFNSLTMQGGQLSHDVVTAVYPDENQIYVGLDGGGLNIYDRLTEKKRVYTIQNSNIAGNHILSICGDGQYIWLGAYGKGLCRFSPLTHSFKTYNLAELGRNQSLNQIWEIKQDDLGNIWIIGTNVCFFNKETECLTIVAELKDVGASSIAFDNEAVWISSIGRGIYKLDKHTGEVLAHYFKGSEKMGIEDNAVRYIFIDSKHQLWFSTEYSGLYKLNEKDGKLVSYGKREGLIENKVVSIQEDESGYLWMGTYNGLLRYDSVSENFTCFGKADNLLAGQFNYHSCAQDRKLFYFGTTKGLVYFDPEVIRYTHQTNSVYFTSLELLNNEKEKKHLYGDSSQVVHLTYDQNFFTIRFAIPEMLTSGKVRFSCYMENFEQGWQDIDYKRQVSYTNVPPGEYTFYVKSSDNSGRWAARASSLRIIITPPWWQTGWAWSLWILLSIMGLIVVFWFYRHELNIKHLVQLKEMEKDMARNINEAKLRFYTNITHELRTPIFLITAPLEELISSAKGAISVPKSNLVSMYRNAMKLNRLISRIIDFRKLESGKLQLEKQSLNVVSFCKDLMPDYEALCQQKNIIFHFLPAKTIIKLEFDPEKLEIILSNLISNAFKYTSDGGKIVLAIDETDDAVTFSIEDNGIGIKKEFQETVFERFFQIDSSQTTSIGDGIGLSFVKHLVELHDGTVWVESELNRGSKFMFNIPKRETLANSVQDGDTVQRKTLERQLSPVISVSSPAATFTILIIDDEQEVLELLECSLVEDFKVLKANNGMDGLVLAQEALPDIIICDVMMPKMGGIDFLNLIKQDKKLAHIPVIMLTAKIAEEDKMIAFDSGADAYLTKPISLKYLRKRIDHLLARRESVAVTNLLVKTEKNYSKEEQRFLLKCREIIDDNLTNPDFGIVFFAEKLGMSHSSFYRKIKSITGMSGIEFINEYRIFKAVQYFKEGERNVNSVCVKCGFNDAKSFRDSFKKKMQMTPKQFIDQGRNVASQ